MNVIVYVFWCLLVVCDVIMWRYNFLLLFFDFLKFLIILLFNKFIFVKIIWIFKMWCKGKVGIRIVFFSLICIVY